MGRPSATVERGSVGSNQFVVGPPHSRPSRSRRCAERL